MFVDNLIALFTLHTRFIKTFMKSLLKELNHKQTWRDMNGYFVADKMPTNIYFYSMTVTAHSHAM